MNDIKARLLNTHTINGVGIALAALGVFSADKLDAVNSVSGGNPVLTALGIALVVAAKVLRKA